MITVIDNASLRSHNTFRMDVTARRLITFTSAEDIPTVAAMTDGEPRIVIGDGSNLLFTGDFPGAVIRSNILTLEAEITPDGDMLITVGSGMEFDSIIEYVCRAGRWGMENLTDIPGQVGASAVQNIGAYGAEVADIIEHVRAYDTITHKFVTLPVSDCNYAYRDSLFKHERGRYIVSEVIFRLSASLGPKLDYGNLRSELPADEATLTPMMVREAVRRIRAAKLPDPDIIGSAGSFFKNPVVTEEDYKRVVDVAVREFGSDTKVPHYLLSDGMVKIPAAWLIEKAGWKGRTLGNAAVWHLQPLIIVNATGHATPDEIIHLEQEVQSSVKSLFDISLSPEVDHI